MRAEKKSALQDSTWSGLVMKHRQETAEDPLAPFVVSAKAACFIETNSTAQIALSQML
jgi:hypothetical protein